MSLKQNSYVENEMADALPGYEPANFVFNDHASDVLRHTFKNTSGDRIPLGFRMVVLKIIKLPRK
jgi:hypothetical protein